MPFFSHSIQTIETTKHKNQISIMIDWKTITEKLRHDSGYALNLELASEIVDNMPRAVHYYLTDIGNPIMSHIEHNILHRNVTGDYYQFLSMPFDKEAQCPLWHKVAIYRGEDCMLSSYTSCIACRHFCKVAEREKHMRERGNDILDYVDYEALLGCERAGDDDGELLHVVRDAFGMLSERDREVLRCLVVDNMPSLDAFPQLERFITPRAKNGMTPDEVKASWTTKQRQDALALMKGRALQHLKACFKQKKQL